MTPSTAAAQVETLAAQRSAKGKLEREDVRFRARELREFCGWGNSQLHLHLSRLVALEYVLAHRADHGAGFVYELVYDGGGKDGKRHLPGLLDVEKLRAAHGYAASHPGVNGAHPAPVRPGSGLLPGPVRAEENAASSSGNGAPESREGENPRPRSGEKDAAS